MLLELAIAQPRRYGANEPAVQARLLALLRELAWVVDEPAGRDAIAAQLRRMQATLAAQDFDITERAG